MDGVKINDDDDDLPEYYVQQPVSYESPLIPSNLLGTNLARNCPAEI